MPIENEYGSGTGRKKTKELIAILLESRFYLDIPLKERLSLIKMILKEYQFLS